MITVNNLLILNFCVFNCSFVLRDQLKNSVEKVEYHGGKDKLPDENLRHHEHLQNKVQDLAAKVGNVIIN